MSDFSPGPRKLPLEARRRLEAVCARFEAALQAGLRPRPEDYLDVPAGPEHLFLLRELIPLEVYYRRRAGEAPTAADYCRRFPQLESTWLQQAVSASTADRPGVAGTPPPTPTGPLEPDVPGPAAAAATPRADGLAGGTACPGYEVLEELAQGGMGIVYRVRDLRLRRDLALKVLRPEYQDRLDARQRFLEEVQIAGQLQHPGIVPVHELGNLPDGRPFFTMKLVRGRTLAELLVGRPAPSHELPHFVGIFQQVCQAVASAHSKGVLHRDLKPANVMVGAFGEVQVMDWGLAKLLDADHTAATPSSAGATVSVVETARTDTEDAQTQAGAVLGTLAYMAPEQALGEIERVDRRSDVFGLGAILCEILTGLPPYTGSSRQVNAQAQLGQVAGALGRLEGCGADGELVALARACLQPRPEDRPADAAAVAVAVAGYLAGVEQRLRQAELERAAAEARATVERRARRLTGATSATRNVPGSASRRSTGSAPT
jgi:serine/threonine protein kinase